MLNKTTIILAVILLAAACKKEEANTNNSNSNNETIVDTSNIGLGTYEGLMYYHEESFDDTDSNSASIIDEVYLKTITVSYIANNSIHFSYPPFGISSIGSSETFPINHADSNYQRITTSNGYRYTLKPSVDSLSFIASSNGLFWSYSYKFNGKKIQ